MPKLSDLASAWILTSTEVQREYIAYAAGLTLGRLLLAAVAAPYANRLVRRAKSGEKFGFKDGYCLLALVSALGFTFREGARSADTHGIKLESLKDRFEAERKNKV